MYFPFVSLCLSHVSVGTGRTTLLLYRRVFWWWGALVCPPCLRRCQCEEQGDALQSGNSFSWTLQDSLELSRSKRDHFGSGEVRAGRWLREEALCQSVGQKGTCGAAGERF